MKLQYRLKKLFNYARIQKVWELFKIKNIGEYHDLYAQKGALLLANVIKV